MIRMRINTTCRRRGSKQSQVVLPLILLVLVFSWGCYDGVQALTLSPTRIATIQTSSSWIGRRGRIIPLIHVEGSFRTRMAPLFVASRESSSSAAAQENPEDEGGEIDLNLVSSSSSSVAQQYVTGGAIRGQKFRRLKDMIWVRETIEDLTAAEFACTVEAASLSEEDESKRRKRRRAVDYDKLLSNLNKRIQDLGCEISTSDIIDDSTVSCSIQNDFGMGTTIYTADQRNELLT